MSLRFSPGEQSCRKTRTAWCKPMGQIILRLDRLMLERKISLNDLAARVGITYVNLSKMKNNHVNAIRFSTLASICQVLHCQPGDILEYVEDEE